MNRTFQRGLTSEDIRRVACPICEAPSGSPCTEFANYAAPREREHHHKERVAAVRRLNSMRRQPRDGLDPVRQRVAEKWLRP